MANITAKIAAIRQAIFGKDVRESIASGIEAINAEVESTTARQVIIDGQEQTRINNENTRKSNETSRNTTFYDAENDRASTFSANENARQADFLDNESVRNTLIINMFNTDETDRQNTFLTNEANRGVILTAHINNFDMHVTVEDKIRWNRIDDVIRLLDKLYSGAPITNENNINFTTETGEIWTM